MTKADAVINLTRKYLFADNGASMLSIELMAASRYDISDGMEVMRFSPRQSVVIVAGTVTYKMAEVVRQLIKWVQMGRCDGCCASLVACRSYAVMQELIILCLSMFMSVVVLPP